MELEPGTQLGAYRLLGLLGKGGMGEVYRASDTRLNREVAVKILPASFANDQDRLRRFEQEARATSALNHPNILTIYDIGTLEGAPYIVAELLEGEELREHLDHGPIPARKAIEYAIQIASGLAAAHAKAIVHRDLKPENIFVTADGRVKILDFGLAKLRPQGGERDSGSDVQTQRALTDPGVVMGTVGYMSPEQVRGQNTDHRADLFSFGVILYEMLAGRRAFTGESPIEVMNAILKEHPPELSETNSRTNPALEGIVRRCLEKKPEMRFHSAHDLGFALGTLTTTSGSRLETGAALPALTEGTGKARLFGDARLAWIVAGSLLLIALALAGVAYLRPTAVARSFKLSALPPERATLMSGQAPVISPDGSRLAFVGVDEKGGTLLYVRALDSLAAQPLSGTDGAVYPFWSPDSRSIGFFGNGKLKRIEAAGGQPVTLADAAVARGGSWNRDGVIIYTPTPPSPIFRISASGGEPTAITSIDFARGEFSRLFPQFLPDGRHYLYFSPANQKPGTRIVGIGSLDSAENKQLLNVDFTAVYAPPGYLLFRRETTLMAQRFDAGKLELSGDPFPVAEQVGIDGLSYQTLASASDNGVLAYQSVGAGDTRLVWFDRQGKQLGVVGPPGDYSGLALSPDDKRLAFQQVDPDTGNVDIWLTEFTGGSFSRFTFEPIVEFSPVWSPDGSRIAFAVVEGPPNLFQKLSSGAGEVVPLFKSPIGKLPSDWSGDGRFIICETVGLTTRWDLWVLSLNGESKFEMFLETPNDERRACFAPSGRWIAYESDESGKTEVYVRSFPASGARWQVSAGGGSQPRFARDGKELFYISADRKIMAAPVKTDGVGFESSAPRALFETHILMKDRPGNQFVVTSDGQRFLINSTIAATWGSPISVVINWMPEGKK
jgi:eukaryotic-like serine/threonine-protein kinase